MVDIPQDRRIVLEDHADLTQGLEALGGEGRLRQLYTPDPAGMVRRWTGRLGERAWIRTREQAVAQGWFGPEPDPALTDRIGDVVVAMRERWAVMARSLPGEWGLVGMHGSLTPDEMRVPLLVAEGGQ